MWIRSASWQSRKIRSRNAVGMDGISTDDGDHKTTTILNRLVTWVCFAEPRNQIEIEADPRSRNLACADETGSCECKVSGNTSSESARVDSANADETRQGESSMVPKCTHEGKLHVCQSRGCTTSDEGDCTIHVREGA